MSSVRFYFDDSGRPAVAAGVELDVLRTFIEDEVGGWEEVLREALRAGRDERTELIGNAHTVTLTADTAVIESDYFGPSVAIPIREFERLMEEWIIFNGTSGRSSR